jgi:hypothetical protein
MAGVLNNYLPRTCPPFVWRNEQSRHLSLGFCAFWLLVAGGLGLCFAPQTASGATYYVDDANGNDSNPGTEMQPWKTLARAYDSNTLTPNVGSGDTVYLKNGNYRIFDEDDVTRTDWITYKNATGHTPVFAGISIYNSTQRNTYLKFDGIKVQQPAPDPMPPDDGYNHFIGYVVYIRRANYVDVRNCVIVGFNKYLTTQPLYVAYSQYVNIYHNDMSVGRAGMDFDFCSDANFTYNYLHDLAEASPVGIDGSTGNVLIEGNHVFKLTNDVNDPYYPHLAGSGWHPGTGIAVRSSNLTIRKNIFHYLQCAQGIMFYGARGAYHNITIENNLFYDMPEYNFYYCGTNILIRNNTFYGGRRNPGLTSGDIIYKYENPVILTFYTGYDGNSVELYNNLFVSWWALPSPTDASLLYLENHNIFWSRLSAGNPGTTKGANSRIVGYWKTYNPTITHGWPNYFNNIGFTGSTAEYSYAVDGITPFFVNPGFLLNGDASQYYGGGLGAESGLFWDYHLAPNSPGINFGDPNNQPSDSLGSLDSNGFIRNDGPARDATHHSAGCYEYVPADSNNRAPILQDIGNKSVNENTLLTFTVIAADADGDTITYSAQSLPTGATFSNQTFSWTLGYDQANTYNVTFVASDEHGAQSSPQTVTITVNNVNRPPVLAAIGNKSVSENSALSFSVSATDPDGGAITYSVDGLPSGAAFAGQNFTWTPGYNQAGSYDVNFVASDGQAQDSETITITVNNVNRPPVLGSIGSKSVYVNDTLSFSVSAADPDGGTIAFSTDTLPAGATFAGQSFNWQPDSAQVGSHQVTFAASDGTLQDSETITITVLNTDTSPPVVTNCSPGADSIQVPLNRLVVLHITDAGKGVDANSVIIKVNSDVIYSGSTLNYGSARGNCRRLGTKADYTYVYQSNEMFDFDREVTVTVNAADLAGNVMSQQSYSFTTEMRSFGQNKKVGSGSDTLSKAAPATVWDSAGNIWAAWHAGPAGSRDIYVGKLAAGADNFGSSIQLTQSTADQCNPAIAIGSDNKLYVVWQDNRSRTWDIYVSISSDGVSWSAEKRVTDTNDNQVNPAIAVDTSNRAYIVWQDDRNVNQDIYIAASSNGFATETVSQITSNITDQIEPAVAVDSSNTVYVVWTDARNGSSDIYGAASNKGPWTNVPIVNSTGNQSSPAIATESEGSILHLLWVDDRSGNQDIYYATSNGLPSSSLSGSSIIDDTSAANQSAPAIITNSSLKVFACWQDQRNVATNGGDTDLYFAELTSGSRTNVLVGDDSTNSSQSEPAMGIGEYGHPYLVWTDGRSANTEIYYVGSTFVEPVALTAKDVSAPSGAVVGTEPASISSVDDVSIVVPAGAYSCDIRVTISKIKNPQAFAMQCLGSYDFGPSGMQFSQPVTITIPYSAAGSAALASAYWYNSLTGALSQQGITNIENLQISSTLYALRFKTTHFTLFSAYRLSGGGDAGAGGATGGGGGGGGGCSISAGGEANFLEFTVPYIGLSIVMVILKLRDRRNQKTRSNTESKC